MSSPNHANTLTRLHDAFNARDAETCRSLLADDVAWHLPGHHPMAGTYAGRNEVWDRFLAPFWPTASRLDDNGTVSHPDRQHIAMLVDIVLDLGDGEQTLRALEVVRVEQGRIVERCEHHEDEAELDRVITAIVERMTQIGGRR